MKQLRTELVSDLEALPPIDQPEDGAPLVSILRQNDSVLPAKSLWLSSGLDIGRFYLQLRLEIDAGLIRQPERARVIEVEEGATDAS